MYDIITGMSLDYYHRIGKAMLDSFIEWWPERFCITVYSEDNLPIENKRIKVVSLDTLDNGYKEFQDEYNVFKLEARAKTFAKKAYPIMHHLESNYGRLVWLDADLITTSLITQLWLDSLITKDDFSAHFGVPQGNYYSVETGFFIINRENKYKDLFLKHYKNIYQTRDFSDMHKPFDGDAFGKVIRECSKEKGFKYAELNPAPDTIKSPMSKIFESKLKHFKGKRKHQVSVDFFKHNS
jgi:hypothetical protein